MSHNLFSNSHDFFCYIVNKYDIILDENYNNLIDLYYNKKSNDNYIEYINFFKKFNYLNNDINYIYYIIFLYYINKNELIKFIRFFTSIIFKNNIIDKKSIKNFDKINNLNKKDLIRYLKKIINKSEDNVYIFIMLIQYYF